MNITVEFTNRHDYMKGYGANGATPFSRVTVQLKLGDATLISNNIIVDRNLARSEESFKTECERQGAEVIADWFDRVDRMIDKLESL